MKTYRELLNELQSLAPEQLDAGNDLNINQLKNNLKIISFLLV